MIMPDYPTVRKYALLVGGFASLATVFITQGKEANPAYLVLIAGMFGLDSVLRKDEKIQEKANEKRSSGAEAIIPLGENVPAQPTDKPPPPDPGPIEPLGIREEI